MIFSASTTFVMNDSEPMQMLKHLSNSSVATGVLNECTGEFGHLFSCVTYKLAQRTFQPSRQDAGQQPIEIRQVKLKHGQSESTGRGRKELSCYFTLLWNKEYTAKSFS